MLKKLRKNSVIIVLALSLIISSANSGITGALVLKSKDIRPYNEVLKGFGELFRGERDVHDINGKVDYGADIISNAKNLDLIFTIGPKATKSAIQSKAKVPVVYSMVSSPEKLNVLQKKNFFGISMYLAPHEQIKTIKEMAPNISNIGIIYSKFYKGEAFFNENKGPFSSLGVKFVSRNISGPGDVGRTLGEMGGKIDSLWLLPDKIMVKKEVFESLLLHCFENKLFFLTYSPLAVKEGALISVYASYEEIGRRAAALSSELIAGNKPDKSLIYPKESISLNLATAAKIGIEVSREFLTRVTEKYE